LLADDRSHGMAAEMRALGSFCYDELAEQYLVEHSALILALSPRLCDKFSAHPNVVLIRDGVDLTPFRRAVTGLSAAS